MGILQGLWNSVQNMFSSSGFASNDWKNYIMIGIACILLYFAVAKRFEPLLLFPIAFGMLLVNVFPGIMAAPSSEMQPLMQYMAAHPGVTVMDPIVTMNGAEYVQVSQAGGLFYYLYQGVKLGIYPPLIFFCIGAMTDFGPLIASPKSLILGAAAQLGVFLAFIVAVLIGNLGIPGLSFTLRQAGSIGMIGAADSSTVVFVANRLAPELLGPIAVVTYFYIAFLPMIQPPIMRLLTTKEERMIVMTQLRPVSKLEKMLFSIIITILVALLLPDAAPLVGMLMLGNLMREFGATLKLPDTIQNTLMTILVVLLGVTVGATATGKAFLNAQTLGIILLGLIAIKIGTAGGILFGKILCWATHGKINPLIGSAGVSAVPMAARVSQKVGQEENPENFLLTHAMGPNAAGIIYSAVVAGTFLSILR